MTITLSLRNDSMESYVADRAPHMSAFVFFPRSTTIGKRESYMGNLYCLMGEFDEDGFYPSVLQEAGLVSVPSQHEMPLEVLVAEIEAELPAMERALAVAEGGNPFWRPEHDDATDYDYW